MPEKSWRQVHSDSLALAGKVKAFNPDIIVPCMLGGLVPGMLVAKALGVKDVRPIDIEREGDERRIAYDVQGHIKGKKVLILEDDLPTGKGPAVAKKIFEQRGAEVKIAAVYVNEKSATIVDFYAEKLGQLPDWPWKKQHSGDRLRP